MLEVKDLTISFNNKIVVNNISFAVPKGEVTALVGESGSGKTVSSLALTKLDDEAVISGQVILDNTNLLELKEKQLQHIRGSKISYIFQEPMSSLNPLHTVEKQISESLKIHKKLSKKQTKQRVIELLELVGFKNPETRLKYLPHQLSGGQRQRIMIAQALANEPELLIADEPTTALDVTIQKQIIDLLKYLKKHLSLTVLFITHDLGLVKAISDKIIVMKNGEIIETGKTSEVLALPRNAYTRHLINSYNTPFHKIYKPDNGYTIEAENISVDYHNNKNSIFRAVNDVSFKLQQGYTLGIVGESGSGKTTLAMSLLHLEKFYGEIYFKGENISNFSSKQLQKYRKKIQIVFQDPFSSLNPRFTVRQILLEGLELHYDYLSEEEKDEEISKTLTMVGLDGEKDQLKYPFEFSGGQRQRIAIARAIILKPELLILDEPTSSLDISLRYQIIELLRNIQKEYQTSYIFISHDMKTIRAMCDDVIVMKDGKVIETASNSMIMRNPKEKYTQKLIESSFDFRL